MPETFRDQFGRVYPVTDEMRQRYGAGGFGAALKVGGGFATGFAAGGPVGGVMGATAAAKSVEKKADQIQAQRQAEAAANQGGSQPLVHPGMNDAINQRGQLASQLGGRQHSQFRGQQQQLIDQLQADARGQGLAQEMIRRQVGGQVQSGIQNQLAQAAGARGGFNPLASRTAATQSALISGQGGQAAAMGGLQAQLGAQGQLAGALQGARGQDQGFADLTQRGQLGALGQQNQLFNIYGGGLQSQAGLNAARERLQMQLAHGARNDPSFWDQAAGFAVGGAEMYANRGAKNKGTSTSGGGGLLDFNDQGLPTDNSLPHYPGYVS